MVVYTVPCLYDVFYPVVLDVVDKCVVGGIRMRYPFSRRFVDYRAVIHRTNLWAPPNIHRSNMMDSAQIEILVPSALVPVHHSYRDSPRLNDITLA